MSDLVEFLRARPLDDEQAARNAAADHPNWTYDPERFAVYTGGYPIASHRFGDPLADVDGLHIARHDPARALREVEAKRTLLGYCERAMSHEDPLSRDQAGEVAMAAITVTYLALPYGDHPDYRQEWKAVT